MVFILRHIFPHMNPKFDILQRFHLFFACRGDLFLHRETKGQNVCDSFQQRM